MKRLDEPRIKSLADEADVGDPHHQAVAAAQVRAGQGVQAHGLGLGHELHVGGDEAEELPKESKESKTMPPRKKVSCFKPGSAFAHNNSKNRA